MCLFTLLLSSFLVEFLNGIWYVSLVNYLWLFWRKGLTQSSCLPTDLLSLLLNSTAGPIDEIQGSLKE